MVGHEAAIRLLKGQLAQGHLAPTYLLVGLKGIGKQTLALELAKALECPSANSGQAPSGEACDTCQSCEGIARGSFPDVMRIAPDSDLGTMGIDQVRALANGMILTPHTGRWKVGLIDRVDQLTEEGSYACLKLLEEPPGKSLFILTASNLNRLPATLVSRCHLIRCFPQGIQQVARFLREEKQVDPALATMLATGSSGRLGLALEFYQKERLATKNAALNQLLSAWKKKLPEIPLGNAPRAEVEEALEWLAAWWRDLVVLGLQGDPAWIIHQDRIEDLRRESRNIDELLELVERTYRVEEAIQRNASPRIALAALLCN